ncbi:unnamed protein product [Cylicostephanus goldi]|uniref:Uncharacterized protein n=1 Tax=Cylicostephanus goldi TaxID=71465 RepID=A0A3P7PTS9_CYLGO|nr:unnamed protein product [Cylicostephanus goldi]
MVLDEQTLCLEDTAPTDTLPWNSSQGKCARLDDVDNSSAGAGSSRDLLESMSSAWVELSSTSVAVGAIIVKKEEPSSTTGIIVKKEEPSSTTGPTHAEGEENQRMSSD